MEIASWIAKNSRAGTLKNLCGENLDDGKFAFGDLAKIYQEKGNNLWLRKGDRVQIQKDGRWLGEKNKGEVIKEYDTYYLIKLDNGRTDTLHKVNTDFKVVKL